MSISQITPVQEELNYLKEYYKTLSKDDPLYVQLMMRQTEIYLKLSKI